MLCRVRKNQQNHATNHWNEYTVYHQVGGDDSVFKIKRLEKNTANWPLDFGE
jgi:hypothetical protein